jgi:hypothetical protein
MDTLKEALDAAMPPTGIVEKSAWSVEYVCDDQIGLIYGRMYEAPVLGIESLLAIGEAFGTKSVDVNNYAHGGCDTCDYGSDYGHTIQVRNPTKNIEEARKLIGDKKS